MSESPAAAEPNLEANPAAGRPPAVVVAPALNPAQQQIIDLLGRAEAEPAPVRADLVDELRSELHNATAPLLRDLAGEKLWVSKHALSAIHGCEAQYVSSRDDFSWSVHNTRGVVAHRAIELSVHWRGDKAPGELVDEAMGRFINDDRGPATYLARLPEAERAHLRGEATDLVAKFLECFPPIKDAWWVRSEGSIIHELHDGLIVLSGKPDLTLGRVRTNVPAKVVIDLKTGARSPAHREDLRFYALVETLRMGVPPRKIATYYVDLARAEAEDVTEAHLHAATRRVVDGVTKLVEVLHADREPNRQPGPPCRWCKLRPDCGPGTTYLRRDEEDTADPAEPW